MKKRTKAFLSVGIVVAIVATVFAGCSLAKSNGNSNETSNAEATNTNAISVISREEGSGTRGAFIELFGIEEKDASGNKVDNTIDSAEVTNSTSVMMTTVAGNKDAIGYISMGSMNDTIKALKVDGVDASVENVKNGTYKIARPFNIVTKSGVSKVAQDFIDYIMSADGQKVIEDNGYISEGNTGAYKGTKPSGKITVAGSSSVTPVMEKLKEAYIKVNSSATIDIQQSDSTTGVTSTIDGVCDIGMASRDLKDTETAKGVKGTVIAKDGIAVIVNKDNSVSDIKSDSVKGIYTGQFTKWSDINA